MNFFKKIGSFFAAAVPFIVYITVQLVTVTLGVILVIAGEMMSSSELSGTISHKSNMAITVAVNLICLIAALWEMKIHRFGFKDISPVVQNKKVYIFAAFFAFGASLVFKFVPSLEIISTFSPVPHRACSFHRTRRSINITISSDWYHFQSCQNS